MKKKLLTIVFATLVFSVPLLSIVNGQALSDVLKDLRSELKLVLEQSTQEQEQFQKSYGREHKRMVDIITASNELSILLYTQEPEMTFDLAYALNKVSSAYKDFSKDRKPYDRFVRELDMEIDRLIPFVPFFSHFSGISSCWFRFFMRRIYMILNAKSLWEIFCSFADV
jgi:hypothetical protein